MYESQRLSETSIYDILENSCGHTTTIYTHDKDNFYRYAFCYQSKSTTCHYKKFILTTSQLIEENNLVLTRPIKSYAKLSFQDIKEFGNMFDSIFNKELIYVRYTDMIQFVMQRIRLGKVNPEDKTIKELVDLYPESFI